MSMWASHAIGKLLERIETQVTPHGNSMNPKVKSGQTVTLSPYSDERNPEVGDIVLCRVKGSIYLHLIKATRSTGANTQYQIGNNRGGINGWTSTLYGYVTKIED